MTDQTGQQAQALRDTDENLRVPNQRTGKKMNGDWKKIMFQVYGLGAVFIIAIGVIWQTVLLPQLKESQSSAATLREQIPKQTLLLEDIRDQGVESRMFEKAVSSTHSAQSQLLPTPQKWLL